MSDFSQNIILQHTSPRSPEPPPPIRDPGGSSQGGTRFVAVLRGLRPEPPLGQSPPLSPPPGMTARRARCSRPQRPQRGRRCQRGGRPAGGCGEGKSKSRGAVRGIVQMDNASDVVPVRLGVLQGQFAIFYLQYCLRCLEVRLDPLWPRPHAPHDKGPEEVRQLSGEEVDAVGARNHTHACS